MYTGIINSILMITVILFVKNETYLKPLDCYESENEDETQDEKKAFLLSI